MFEDLAPCINWVASFAITVRDAGMVHMKTFENIAPDDLHNIQTHDIDLDMLVSANDLHQFDGRGY